MNAARNVPMSVNNMAPAAQDQPIYPTAPAAPKKGLKGWHIALIIVGAVLALIILLIVIGSSSGNKGGNTGTSSGSSNASANNHSGRSSVTDAGDVEIPIVGNWKLGIDETFCDVDSFSSAMSAIAGSADGESGTELWDFMVETLGKSVLADIFSSGMDPYEFNFSADGSAHIYIDVNKFRDADIEMCRKAYDALAKLSLEEAAEIFDMSVEELEEQLNGSTWAERCHERAELYASITSLTMTDERLEEMFNGKMDDNGIIEKEAGGYSLNGNRLIVIDNNGGEVGTMIISYQNGTIIVEDVEAKNIPDDNQYVLSMMFKGVVLKKVS